MIKISDPVYSFSEVMEHGYMVCPNGKRFYFLRTAPIKKNQYGRTEESYQGENCEGCRALLRMNRRIQAEGTFGEIKWNRGCWRLRRRGAEGAILELGLVAVLREEIRILFNSVHLSLDLIVSLTLRCVHFYYTSFPLFTITYYLQKNSSAEREK